MEVLKLNGMRGRGMVFSRGVGGGCWFEGWKYWYGEEMAKNVGETV